MAQCEMIVWAFAAWFVVSTFLGELKQSDAFIVGQYQGREPTRGCVWGAARRIALLSSSTDSDVVTQSQSSPTQGEETESQRPPCFFKTPEGRWLPRIELEELTVGQRLETAWVVQELLDGKTGPKLWVECGVGRYRIKRSNKSSRTSNSTSNLENQEQVGDGFVGDWKIQTAMLRLGQRGTKRSVTEKRAARLRKKKSLPVFVSRIRPDCDQLEVCLTGEEVSVLVNTTSDNVSVVSLQPGQELVGRVQRLEPYGALLDVGANRHGLLHIKRVGELFGRFIDKEEGLKQAGLTRGAQIKVQVLDVRQRRLFLDFTNDVKEEAEKEKKKSTKRQSSDSQGGKKPRTYTESSTQSIAAPAAPPPQPATPPVTAPAPKTIMSESKDDYEEEEDFDDEDDVDEDREIEDALGLGSY